MATSAAEMCFRVLGFLILSRTSVGFQNCPSDVVGVDDSNIIPDSSFTASSTYNSRYVALKARFSSDRGWAPKDNTDPNDYLQIDLGKVFSICAVATEGNKAFEEWTTEYKISTSMDGRTWTWYPNNSNAQRFIGNSDRNTAVKRSLHPPVLAKFIRFIPTKYQGHKVLRVELYGIGYEGFQDCPSALVGVDDSNIIPNSSFTASSAYHNRYVALKARLSSDRGWAPKYNTDPNDYLQIDLGKVFFICAVATKGNKAYQEWTTEYKISTSLDNRTWTLYQDNNAVQPFTGNKDNDIMVKHSLSPPVLAKLIRFIPTKYQGHKALRVELYGMGYEVFTCNSLSVGVAKIPDGSMTSSTNFNASTKASNGKIDNSIRLPWCSATSDSSSYLQMDLGASYVICGATTLGDGISNQWVQDYHIQTSTDGTSFIDYMQNNIVQEFTGNIDPSIPAQNLLFDGAVGQYVRIRPDSSYGSTNCLRTELYGVKQSTVCPKIAVGVQSPMLVPNHRFTASSYNVSYREPQNARLRNTLSWAPTASNPTSSNWLQLDLGSVLYMCALATQGNPDNQTDEYVKNYKLKISLDGVYWKYYQENGTDKEFVGNTDGNSIVTNNLAVPAKTKFIRIYPKDFNNCAAMRIEVYGVPLVCGKPFGLENSRNLGQILLTSSSNLDNTHKAFHGRLYGNASWCSDTSSSPQYLQVDFGETVTLSGIATQGDPIMDKWVETYRITYSVDGSRWAGCEGRGNVTKVFQGNNNQSSVVFRWLSRPVTVRHVKVHPISWNTAICLRIELFGCKLPSPPQITELRNQNLQASKGSYVELTCKVQEPLVGYIEWHSDGNDVTNRSSGLTRSATYVKSVLRINYTNAADILNTYKCVEDIDILVCRTNYRCIAKYEGHQNTLDAVKSVQVQVLFALFPVLPSSSFQNILTTSVVVSWTYPNASHLPIKNVIIKYWKHQRPTTVYVPYPITYHTIAGLSACRYYNVTIKAVGLMSDGPWTNITSFRTKSELPNAPSGVTALSKTSQSILVTWEEPYGMSCSPDGYKISFSTARGGDGKEVVIRSIHKTSYTLTNLNKWTDYYISVTIHNEKGYGPPSTVKQRSKEDKPDAAPTDFRVIAINDTSAHLSWNLPLYGPL